MSLLVYPTLPGLTFTVGKTPEFNTIDQRAPNGYAVRISQDSNPIWHFTLVYEYLRDFPWGPNQLVSELRTLMGFFTYHKGQAGSFLFQDPSDYHVGPGLITTHNWTPNTYYALNSSVWDASGHWQQVTVAGISGAGPAAPAFSSSGGTTTDGTVTWQDMGHYGSGAPNVPLAQLPLITDGTTYYSPIQRTLDGLFYEDVTDLINGITSLSIYANGVLKTGSTSPSTGDFQLLGPGLAINGTSYMGLYLQWNTTPTGPITAAFDFYFRVHFESDSVDLERFTGDAQVAAQAGQGGGFWTLGGSNGKNGSGSLRLESARPNPL